MLRSGKDQNNERSESNSTLWYNFRLNYSQVLQLVVSTQRQVAQIILSNYGNALSALNQSGFMDKHLLCWACRRHMKKVFWCFKVTEQFAQVCHRHPYESVACKATSHHRYFMNYCHHRLLPK